MTDLIVENAYEKKKIWTPVTPLQKKEGFDRASLSVHSG
jgi:hypothetical protein